MRNKSTEREIYNLADEVSNCPKWGEQWNEKLMNYLLSTKLDRDVLDMAKICLENKDILIIGGGGSESKIVNSVPCKSISVINISEKEIERYREYYPKFTKFFVMDAEKTDFNNASFDVVLAHSILHHLELNAALTEIKRLLRPNGIFFIADEPIALNIIAFIGRKFFPTNIHTPDEKPFIVYEFRKKIKKYGFKEINFKTYYLFSLLIPIFSKYIKTSTQKLKKIIDIALLVEDILIRLPYIKEFCWNFAAIYKKN